MAFVLATFIVWLGCGLITGHFPGANFVDVALCIIPVMLLKVLIDVLWKGVRGH